VEYIVPTIPESMRWLILGSAFAIDLDFFQSRGRGGLMGLGGSGGGTIGRGGISGRGF